MGRYLKALILPLFILVALATLTPPASAGYTTTIPQLRSQLEDARQHLYAARHRLATATADHRIVLAVFEAQAAADATDVSTDGTTATTDGTATTTDGTATTTDGTATTTDGALTTDGAAATTDPLLALSPAVAELVLADKTITQEDVDLLQKAVSARRASVRLWEGRARALKRKLDIRLWNRSGEWRPLIGIAAARYRVSEDGLYRLMMLESGGNRYAGRIYVGLFQYYPGTWRGGWNPWRGFSIYDGWSQIRATAYAIHRGMGPGHWPNTYPRAF